MKTIYPKNKYVDIDLFEKSAGFIRVEALKMIYNSKLGHLGSELSVAEILSVLYLGILNVDPKDPYCEDRDRFILSKAHSSAALYAALQLRGFFEYSKLSTYIQPFSDLGAVVSNRLPGVEACTGALGHGLPIGVGEAIAAKHCGSRRKVIVLMGDGEMQEGTTWEAAMFASTRKLDNLIVIIDRNQLQKGNFTENTNKIEPLKAKWESFGWNVGNVDGHDVANLFNVLSDAVKRESGIPVCIVASTVKGKGVSFMENQWRWHNLIPDAAEFEAAIGELQGACV